ncbi:hypothetical protein [Lacibacter sp. H407]|uniref:hypothetical protein n=1 Tax=Lacibacter sp. H407 TaxID=3133423 RepID=UPI0030BD8AA1
MKLSIAGMYFLLISLTIGCSSQKNSSSSANNASSQQEIISLSKEKWQWMADKNVDKLATLFHDQSKFVHMSGT